MKELFVFKDNKGSTEKFMNDFEVEPIGRGSFFQVFRGRRKVDGKSFAIKKSIKGFRGKGDRENYLKEIRAVSKQVCHPNIVEYCRAWQEEGHFFIQMEYCLCSLEDYLENHSEEINEEMVWKIAIQVGEGLSHVHRNKVLHLDVKPANVMVALDGTLKLGDFGQAVLQDQYELGEEGDSRYLAPEMLVGDTQPRASADMFSLGIMLLEIVSQARLPGNGPMWHRLRQGSISEFLEDRVSMELQHVIERLMDPNPNCRMTASELLSVDSYRYHSYSSTREMNFPTLPVCMEQDEELSFRSDPVS